MKKNETAGPAFKMSTRQPIIKFSPFEALLIGEKNKILKPQPIKNAIFLTKLKKPSRIINLRDLFGLENNSKGSDNNEVVFKMPQRVRDFLRNRRLKNNSSNNNQNDLCYELESPKMFVTNSEGVKTKYQKAKIISNKVRLKKKIRHRENRRELDCKFSSVRRKKFCRDRYKKLPRVALKELGNTRYSESQHKLRKKDEKSGPKRNKENRLSRKIKKKQKNIVQRFHYCTSVPSFSNINKILNSNIKYFEFPVSTLKLDIVDFENDRYLTDIIYETFPKSIRFESEDSLDYENFFKNSKICNGRTKNGCLLEKSMNSRISYVKLNKISDSAFTCSSRKNLSESAEKGNIKTGARINNLFFKGKDAYIEDLVKPFVSKKWIENLSEFSAG